ncbi:MULTISPECIES: hypothetical protein [unclassified Rhizobium]|uniref:hypothetical protein n=1 Tax=unclassified Rhizobium TaxID=2613769 RepID=UPI0017D83C34|nr:MULTISPECIES: hypothetical protein [unclassified Rhizobium]MBB3386988.1 hypothetical protein [Rhizobium sp. BK098]MBB3618641.1 hypothetical protein [Rhizobium sp. BK609]MBB3684349.1 hypothetical protein [Rhizobium sp. BK612]
MLQIGHRESFDVDIFIDDPQVLPYLNPQTQGFALDLYPDAYTFDGTHALKIVFKDIGEVALSSQRTLGLSPREKEKYVGRGFTSKRQPRSLRKRFSIAGAQCSRATPGSPRLLCLNFYTNQNTQGFHHKPTR